MTVFVLTASPVAQAQTAPDAGALRQQIEREVVVPQPGGKPLPLPAPQQPPLARTGRDSVTVRAFRFQGNTQLSDEELARVVRPWTDRAVDYAGLQAAAAAVGDAYRTAGWVVRTVLPGQDITNGVITLQIIEARVGTVRVDGPESTRVPIDQIMGTIQQELQPGALLNVANLDRGFMLADDLPGVVVTGYMQEGAAEGLTDLLVRLGDEPPYMGDVTLDNTGARSTGDLRLVGDIALLSPLRRGDLLSTAWVHTDGSDYARVAYTVPVGVQGLRVGVNASWLQYHLVAPEFTALQARGESGSGGLETSYPLVRSRAGNLYATGNLDVRTFDNRANGSTTSHYRVQDFSLGLRGEFFDAWGDGGANAASLQLVDTQLNLSGSPSQSADATSVRTEGRSTKLRYSLSRQQTLGRTFSLFAVLSGQWADKNQDSSEKFYLGGAYGVRAYPTNEAGGAAGQLLNLELRASLPNAFVATAFYDWGQVRVNADNQFTGAPARNEYSLSGAGLSLSARRQNIVLKATWARRIGTNPDTTLTGMDQDGSRVIDRFWLSASTVF